MGRGRKGVDTQSKKMVKSNKPLKNIGFLNKISTHENKITIPEEALEFMKSMNPQQLADVLLNDDWYVKTSSGNASGN